MSLTPSSCSVHPLPRSLLSFLSLSSFRSFGSISSNPPSHIQYSSPPFGFHALGEARCSCTLWPRETISQCMQSADTLTARDHIALPYHHDAQFETCCPRCVAACGCCHWHSHVCAADFRSQSPHCCGCCASATRAWRVDSPSRSHSIMLLPALPKWGTDEEVQSRPGHSGKTAGAAAAAAAIAAASPDASRGEQAGRRVACAGSVCQHSKKMLPLSRFTSMGGS